MSKSNNDKNKQSYSYRSAGVDIDAGEALVDAIKPLAAATNRPGVMGGLGGFGGLFDLKAAGYDDPILIAATDGVGTKVKLAAALGDHSTVGVDLVAMCVNDLIVQGGEPLFFLDYFATSKLDVNAATQIVSGIADGCRQAGCALIGGETAEMPGHYQPGDYDLAGFSIGAVERGKILPRGDLAVGDKLFGLASSGLHSNGFSLVRRVIDDHGIDILAPAPFDASRRLGDILLTPTRIYVKALLEALRRTDGIKALAHITGGGLPENLPRILPATLAVDVNLGAITPPPVFGWLKALGSIELNEMLRTFNCGVGMVVIGDDSVGEALKASGEQVIDLGVVTERADAETPVTYNGDLVFGAGG